MAWDFYESAPSAQQREPSWKPFSCVIHMRMRIGRFPS